MYTKEELLSGLQTKTIGCRLFVFDEIDSTNTCAKTLASTGIEDGAVVIADHQTAGRGRLGRSWIAEPKSNLLFSIIVRPCITRAQTGLLPFFAAVSVASAIELTVGKKVECKWPNDLLLNGKKICGILLESAFSQESLDYAVVGIGLNVNQSNYGIELEHKATSLMNETGTLHDLRYIFQHILESLDTLYMDVKKGDFTKILENWNSRAHMFGQPVTLIQGNQNISGIASRITDDGGLIIETSSGLKTFYAGDVFLKKTED
jgi:BirA family biotin operon repressor/biotin-[acetyl-CoA-carboxylase] ligase